MVYAQVFLRARSKRFHKEKINLNLQGIMKIAIPKEIKDNERRVGGTPLTVAALVKDGHEVFVETQAGAAIGFSDEDYKKSGATIVLGPKDVYDKEMVIKVKEPLDSEFPLMHEGLILFCYLHLAPDRHQTEQLLKQKVVGIAYETVTDKNGRLPLLTPMSEIAGRLSIQVGGTALQMINGGKGRLLGGVPGVKPAKVLVIGGGVVGTEAARMAMGSGADVTIFDLSLDRLRDLDVLFGPRLKTMYSSSTNLEKELLDADLVIGAVLIHGAAAPRLISKDFLKKMEKGTVIVDVAIDQGGCFETSKPTSHSDPIYIVDGIVHYCVTNMPGAVARTSTEALTNATLGYALKIAKKGWKVACSEDEGLKLGLNVCLGKVTSKPVATSLNMPHHAWSIN